MRNWLVWLALLTLLALTMALSRLQLGPWSLVASLLIATAKASLVMWFYMELYKSSAQTRLTAVASLLWLALLFGFTLADVLTR